MQKCKGRRLEASSASAPSMQGGTQLCKGINAQLSALCSQHLHLNDSEGLLTLQGTSPASLLTGLLHISHSVTSSIIMDEHEHKPSLLQDVQSLSASSGSSAACSRPLPSKALGPQSSQMQQVSPEHQTRNTPTPCQKGECNRPHRMV